MVWKGGRMRLSTRNQLPGTVVAVHHGEAITTVKVELRGGDVVTSAITREAAEDLGLGEGSAVTVLVKSTDVSLAIDD
jgi:molybdate transport system regulatory protein